VPLRKIRQVQLVGRKIRQLRKERKLTQSQLASKIGVQQSDLSRMEKGEYRVSLDTLFKILAEFDLGIGEFFDDVGRSPVSVDDARLLRDIRSLPEDDQKEIREFVGFKQARVFDGKPERASRRSNR
jgi:transcriptional regulator with XRE-family HTH domain